MVIRITQSKWPFFQNVVFLSLQFMFEFIIIPSDQMHFKNSIPSEQLHFKNSIPPEEMHFQIIIPRAQMYFQNIPTILLSL